MRLVTYLFQRVCGVLWSSRLGLCNTVHVNCVYYAVFVYDDFVCLHGDNAIRPKATEH